MKGVLNGAKAIFFLIFFIKSYVVDKSRQFI